MSKPATSVTVDIEKLVYGGDGLARSEGQVVLVPFVLPGERVEVSASRVKNGLLRGSSPQILGTAEQRITPKCEYFTNCGGCHYQHAGYTYQLEQKRSILRETLQRLGGIAYDGEISLVSAEPWYYRNRIQLHFDQGKLGFRKAESHQLCAIEHCDISSPVLNEVVGKFQAAIRQPVWPKFLRSLEVFTNESEIQLNIVDSAKPVAARFFEWCATFLPQLAHGAIEYSAAGHVFRISRGSFFQVNRFLVDSLVQTVIGETRGTHAVDLYAGVGLFSLPLATRFQKVDAVERGASAFRDLQYNAEQHQPNILPAKASAEEFLASLTGQPDLVVADPPRAGLGRDAVHELLRMGSTQLVIVSCDPATLARDLRVLLPQYEIQKITLVDLFPQTYHFETVVHLTRSA